MQEDHTKEKHMGEIQKTKDIEAPLSHIAISYVGYI
jgi:hypothetical protein